MAIIVGLTGGIGSGKSTVSQYLQTRYQVAVVDADQLARSVVQPGQPAFNAIVDRFPAALRTDGALDRAWLRQHLLPDPELKQWLEAQTHPPIRKAIQAQLAAHHAEPYLVLDAALLLETDLHQQCDLIVVVDVLPEQQLSRVAQRDGTAVAIIEEIMAQQCGRAERLQKADWIIDNTGSLSGLYQAADELHQYVLSNDRDSKR